jgi:hypothetical protein
MVRDETDDALAVGEGETAAGIGEAFCQSASKRDPGSACKRDPLLVCLDAPGLAGAEP